MYINDLYKIFRCVIVLLIDVKGWNFSDKMKRYLFLNWREIIWKVWISILLWRFKENRCINICNLIILYKGGMW